MVEVSVCGCGELEGAEADVVQSLVVNAVRLVGVLDKLVHRQGGVVRLDDGVGNFRRRENGESAHHSIRIFLTNLGNEKSSHTRTGTTTERMSNLKSLKAVTRLRFLSNDIENRIDQFSAFSVVTFSPIVTGSGLTENEIIRSKNLTEGSGANRIHRSGFEIHENRSWNISTAGSFVEVNVDSLELKIRIAVVSTSWINAVLVADNFPELSADLITALTSLNVNNLSH